MTYVFHPGARLEYLAAVDYYERQRLGLGAGFSLEIEAAIARIIEAPLRWPAMEEDVRRCMVNTFPYGILYTVEPNSILILAVMHCSREPGYWKGRSS